MAQPLNVNHFGTIGKTSTGRSTSLGMCTAASTNCLSYCCSLGTQSRTNWMVITSRRRRGARRSLSETWWIAGRGSPLFSAW